MIKELNISPYMVFFRDIYKLIFSIYRTKKNSRHAKIYNEMNFLAHLYLSDSKNEWMVGNFIADAVKGNAIENFSEGIKEGIRMHRAIDSFTDQHPIVKESVQLIRFQQGKFAAVVMDILFDYYLAKDWHLHHTDPLEKFSEQSYDILGSYKSQFPEPMPFVFDMMLRDNWLYNYQFKSGIQKSLNGMQNRVSHPNDMGKGVELLDLKGTQLQENFNLFFNDLKKEFK
jgi:acyl carrier protein phosphodiesterase